jgi:branched-chain amino acid transport system permease protein
MHDILNAFVLLSNFSIIVPAAAYGSQLALGALGDLVWRHLRFKLRHGDIYMAPWW